MTKAKAKNDEESRVLAEVPAALAKGKSEKPTLKTVAGKDLKKQEVREVLMQKYNSRGRGRSEVEKRKSYKKYYENKARAIELETRNKQYLVLFPASDTDTNKHKFYTMGGTSAIIYVHDLAPKLKRKATLRRDMDNCDDELKFRSGICSIADLAALEERLEPLGIKRENYEGDLVYFKLTHEYSKTEVTGLLRAERERVANANKLLYSEVLYPQIHRKILDLERMIPNKVKNMNRSYREVIGMEAIASLMKMVRDYSAMAHGDKPAKETMREMKIECDALLAICSMMNELKVWDIEGMVRIGSTVAELKQLINSELNKIEEKEARSAAKGGRKPGVAEGQG